MASRFQTDTLEERLEKYGWTVTGECWNFTGPIGKTWGYGVFSYHGVRWRAHRAAYAVWVGPLVRGLVIKHACDNRLCINPEHLSQGTQADNMAEMDARGRRHRAVGELGGNSKLTAPQVEAIRDRLAAGSKQVDLAREYGVNDSTISRIKSGKRWPKF